MRLQLSNEAYAYIKERWDGLRDKNASAMGFSIGAWIPTASALNAAIETNKVGVDLETAVADFSDSHWPSWDVVLAAYALDQIPDQDTYVLYGLPFYLPKELESILENSVLNCHDGKLEIIKTKA